MPNQDSIRNDPWENYLTTVDAVEALTGYDLFSNLPPAIQAASRPVQRQQPAARHDPAQRLVQRSGWPVARRQRGARVHGERRRQRIANPADASFSLVTAVVAGTETANAGTDSRVVCDVAGLCATAGPFTGNKIDRKAPSFS